MRRTVAGVGGRPITSVRTRASEDATMPELRCTPPTAPIEPRSTGSRRHPVVKAFADPAALRLGAFTLRTFMATFANAGLLPGAPLPSPGHRRSAITTAGWPAAMPRPLLPNSRASGVSRASHARIAKSSWT
jgi:hypothetical protein